jgi:hypothetical protein
MDEKVIRITCKGATEVPLDELHDLQGNLKDLSVENYHKLKQSILEYGFSFPVFMWVDSEGKKWVIDAHQRSRMLKKLRDEEGYTIPNLPADIIEADDKIQAKEKLLLLNSRYGRMTEEGLNEFIHQEDSPIDLPNIELLLELPDINIDYAKQDGQDFSDKNEEIDPAELAKDLNMKCPRCGFEFKGKEGLDDIATTDLHNEQS